MLFLCENILEISCENIFLIKNYLSGLDPALNLIPNDNEHFQKIIYEEKVSPLCFHNIIPIPEHIFIQGFFPIGRNWCIENWGTKWPAEVTSHSCSDRILTIDFSTAESPPIQVIRKIKTIFPEAVIDFKYRIDSGWISSSCC